jgi:beta-glucosidase
VHNALVAHGEGVRRLREIRPDAKIGITMSCMMWSPATNKPEDICAAELADLQHNLWLLDPLHGKGYPKAFVEYLGDLAPDSCDGDLQTMATPTDYLAVNYYKDMQVRAGTLKPTRSGKNDDYIVAEQRNDANAFRRGLERLNQRYGPRVFVVTENGLQKKGETPDADGLCHDADRVEYLRTHIAALNEAIRAGIDVRGYFVWTVMDNFEWSAGHHARYGLFYTDYPTQRRIPKDSAKWYCEFLHGK